MVQSISLGLLVIALTITWGRHNMKGHLLSFPSMNVRNNLKLETFCSSQVHYYLPGAMRASNPMEDNKNVPVKKMLHIKTFK